MGVQSEKPSVGEVCIFSGTAQYQLKVDHFALK